MAKAPTVPPISQYEQLQKVFWQNQRSSETKDGFRAVLAACVELLAGSTREQLVSQVAGKEYFAFVLNGRSSRAVNTALYEEENLLDRWTNFVVSLEQGRERIAEPAPANRLIYTVAMAFCCSVDVLSSGDQQRPGTYFSYLVAFLFAHVFRLNPVNQMEVLQALEGDEQGKLPTDFIFDLGPGNSKFHLPVKTSTRERVVQIFAHHAILNRVYGNRAYLATPVIIGETKLDKKTRKVTEICIPKQIQIFQNRIEIIDRFYYLDPPDAYLALNRHQTIRVKIFGEFFSDVGSLIRI